MRAFLILLALCCVLSSAMMAQVDSVYTGRSVDANQKRPAQKTQSDFLDRITWGGNFQAWIGNPTFVFLSPNIGFIPVKNVNLGIGVIYNYTNMRSYYGNYSQSIFGGHSYIRYLIGSSYFVQAQLDQLKQPDLFSLDPHAKRWVKYVLVGGGLRQNIGDRISLTTSIMYNLQPDPLSIYPSRVIVQFGIFGTLQ